MQTWAWILIGVAAFLLLSLAGMFCATWGIAKKVYHSILMRTSPEKWGRANSYPQGEEHTRMFNLGMDWGRENAAHMRPVQIENDGLKLAGQYFDFGADRCAIILPGRSESLYYSYFFAPPYAKAGCNVLVIDVRAHGLSEGKYNYCGTREYSDVLAWTRFAHDALGNREIILHGICVGGASAVFAACRPEFPDYVACLVVEGLFSTFRESFALHMKAEHKPVFPVMNEIFWIARMESGMKASESAPIRCIDRVKTPMLFLHGRQDAFSLPKRAQELYDKCTAPKKLVWMEKGSHSHLRINNTEIYDAAITDFLREHA